MPYKVYSIPNYQGTSTDLVFCNTADPNSNGVVHYAYTVGVTDDALSRRMFPWAKIREFAGNYALDHPDAIERLKNGVGYRPGEDVLDSVDGATFATDLETIFRLGALELLANLSSGRLSTTDKDPFPHQLALQQFVRKPPWHSGLRRILIADEVGLGKTIEVGLILRDILLARGRLEGFRCLYLTSGGLIEDAADKLRDVLSGVIDGAHIVSVVSSFREYGSGNPDGVHVASMHAARLYVSDGRKAHLPVGIRPEIVIIDECHHAASEGELAGIEVQRQVATQTYVAVKQLLSGEFWAGSQPPQLAVLMSATPFRSAAQFVNLLRLLTQGVEHPEGRPFSAFDANVHASDLRQVLQEEQTPASVVWRRQSDENVRSWSGNRIFPNLSVQRPHQVQIDNPDTPRLPPPSGQFLELLDSVKQTVKAIARAHGQQFGGFAIAQLEKKLTSSSVAGACWLFSWAVRHCEWATQADYSNDKGPSPEGLRRLLRRISQRIAEFTPQTSVGHATVGFPSDRFKFEAASLAQSSGMIREIQKYSAIMREDTPDDSAWVADEHEVLALVGLGEQLLDLGRRGGQRGAEDAKLAWLTAILERYPNERFLLFTESLQTCEVLQGALGSDCRQLVGSMSRADRMQAVADLKNPRMNARVLVATSAADEGFDLQIASKVIHWDLSSSPATLMQRNGRVARLGQVKDVIAYYLILTGTHEERRDSALQAKFADLGIDDEALKSRILGSLSVDEENQLEEAIDGNADGVVGDILRKAKRDNEQMDQELAGIAATLKEFQVLSRDDLAIRLQNWKDLGLPDAAVEHLKFSFDSVKWERPVFGEVSRMEAAESKRACFQDGTAKQHFVFDPEFLLFGPRDANSQLRLAGIPPWLKTLKRNERPCIVPFSHSDMMGRLLHGASRLRRADFLTIPRSCLKDQADLSEEACWLLFCTHPLREVENVRPQKLRPYLTYYAFADIGDGEAARPIDDEGADADAVHNILVAAERHALAGDLSGLEDDGEVSQAKAAGTAIQQWLESVSRFGAESFLEQEKYFVPMPVALVYIS